MRLDNFSILNWFLLGINISYQVVKNIYIFLPLFFRLKCFFMSRSIINTVLRLTMQYIFSNSTQRSFSVRFSSSTSHLTCERGWLERFSWCFSRLSSLIPSNGGFQCLRPLACVLLNKVVWFLGFWIGLQSTPPVDDVMRTENLGQLWKFVTGTVCYHYVYLRPRGLVRTCTTVEKGRPVVLWKKKWKGCRNFYFSLTRTVLPWK